MDVEQLHVGRRVAILAQLAQMPVAYAVGDLPGDAAGVLWGAEERRIVQLPPLIEAVDGAAMDPPCEARIQQVLDDVMETGVEASAPCPTGHWIYRAFPILLTAGGEQLPVGALLAGRVPTGDRPGREALAERFGVAHLTLADALGHGPDPERCAAAIDAFRFLAEDLGHRISRDWVLWGHQERVGRRRARVTTVTCPARPTSPEAIAQELAERRQQLHEILDSMVEGLLITDGQGVVTLSNPQARSLFDASKGDLEGRHVLDLLSGNRRFADEWRLMTEGLHSRIHEELRIQGLRAVDLEVSATRMSGDGRLATGYLVTLKDITRLNELAHLRDEFISNVKHEFRTPLTTLRGFARTMLDYPSIETERRQEFLQYIVQEAERLGRLIEDMLAMARLDIDRSRPRTTKVDLRDFVYELQAFFGEHCEQRGVSLHVSVPETPVPIQADKDLLTQLGHNIIGNALRFTPTGGIVHVGLEVTDEVAALRVVDNGSGIPAEDLDSAFERVFRATPVHGSVPGSGLGLAIVKRIADAHGWHIGIRSQVGTGTDLWVSLRLDDQRIGRRRAARVQTSTGRPPPNKP